MSSFVTCLKRTLCESPVTVKLSDEIIVEATSDLEMSKERSRFREHLRQSFELVGRSISSHHFWKSQKYSNESRSSVLLKLKQDLHNDAQINETVGSVGNGGLVCRLSSRPHTAVQGFVVRNLPFAHCYSAAAARTRERTHAALPWLSSVQTKPQWFTLACAYLHICACNGVSDICIIVPTHKTAWNAGLDLELARPATESNDAVARVACECALGGALLPFGVRASHCVCIRRNDAAPRTHEFAQATEVPDNHTPREHGHIQAGILAARPGRKSSSSLARDTSPT